LTSSTPSFFCACDRCGGFLYCFHRQWHVSLCPLHCTSGIGNIGACLRPRRVLGSDKPGARVATVALTSSSASIVLDDCLDASTSSSLVLSLMRHHLWHPPWCAHGFVCAFLIFGNLDSYSLTICDVPAVTAGGC